MKRIIAYSTCSQFGYLTAAIGLGQTSSTILHLSSHAGFKALLFVCAGGVLHSMRDEQDLRRLGGLIAFMPFTYSAMLVGSLSLIAFPYLSGHVSKDLILEISASQISVSGNFFWILGSIVAGITACYSLRLLALTFFGGASASRNHYETVHEQPLAIVIPMLILSILAIIFGYLAREPIVGMGTEIITFSNYNLIEAEFGLSLFAKSLALISTLLGISIGFILFIAYPILEPAI
jgi:NADH-ubiquinone oxidoreductase chain 5